MLKSLFIKAKDFLFARFFKINDSAQKIALGVGLGVFAGLLPGAGPAAALCLAFIFRANRAAALFGGLLTNTWLSVITFILAIKLGSAILNKNWQVVQQQAQQMFKSFSWAGLFKISFLEVLFPVITGYFALGLIFGILSYFIVLLVIKNKFPKIQA
ncbi:MAG: DUF2062 domain-containing protein [Candidatus Omnitrophica bacterium]|nr:DUF2062 domain-containing protein [Candidatus Omnitrophota bacterium]